VRALISSQHGPGASPVRARRVERSAQSTDRAAHGGGVFDWLFQQSGASPPTTQKKNATTLRSFIGSAGSDAPLWPQRAEGRRRFEFLVPGLEPSSATLQLGSLHANLRAQRLEEIANMSKQKTRRAWQPQQRPQFVSRRHKQHMPRQPVPSKGKKNDSFKGLVEKLNQPRRDGK
jgi:hypothetical protein